MSKSEFIIEIEENRFPQLQATLIANVRAVVAASAERIAERARELAPVRTGALRNAITVSVSNDGELAEVVVGNDEVDYARYVEYGTAFTRAQPFLTPAVEEEASTLASEIAAAMAGGNATIFRG